MASKKQKTTKKSAKKKVATVVEKKETSPAKKTAKKKNKVFAKKPVSVASFGLTADASGACRACVIGVLKKLSGRDPAAGDTLNDLFNECNAAVIKALRHAFANCPSANPNAPFTCATTVGELLLRVCP